VAQALAISHGPRQAVAGGKAFASHPLYNRRSVWSAIDQRLAPLIGRSRRDAANVDFALTAYTR